MNIEIIKSKRKTIAIEIKKDLRVIVRAPLRMNNQAISAFVDSKSDWIKRNTMLMKKRLAEEASKETEPKFTQTELNDMITNAKLIITSRVDHYAKIIDVKYNKISIKRMTSRWGSCSAKGNLNFNCLLSICPENIRDYVVIHELCHLKELNHSQAFWSEVARYCPNYKKSKEWLRINGNELIRRLP